MDVRITELTPADYEEAYRIWAESEGVGLSAADSKEAITRYLARNPGMSFVARVDGKMVGAVLCGHDGRRGMLHHLAVDRAYHRQGIGRQLAERCIRALEAEGIDKCHIFVFSKNERALKFWKRLGWYERIELVLMSRDIS